MDYALLLVIILQFIYMVYKDCMNAKERKRLDMKSMSKDIGEYRAAIRDEEKPEESKSKKEDLYKPIEDATIEEILKAEDKS